jgi:hypothetical protein
MSRDLNYAVFVCYDDISSNIINEANPVIYNPILDEVEKRTQLHDKVKECFNVELTTEQLDSLCSKDKYHIEEFVEELKSYIYK